MGKVNEIGEDTVLGISIKTLIAIAVAIAVSIGFYYDLRAEVELAKELPKSPITRVEYELKDELVRETIMNTQSDVEDIKVQLDKIEEYIYRRD